MVDVYLEIFVNVMQDIMELLVQLKLKWI